MTAQMASRLTLRSFKHEKRKVSIDNCESSFFRSFCKIGGDIVLDRGIFQKERSSEEKYHVQKQLPTNSHNDRKKK